MCSQCTAREPKVGCHDKYCGQTPFVLLEPQYEDMIAIYHRRTVSMYRKLLRCVLININNTSLLHSYAYLRSWWTVGHLLTTVFHTDYFIVCKRANTLEGRMKAGPKISMHFLWSVYRVVGVLACVECWSQGASHHIFIFMLMCIDVTSASIRNGTTYILHGTSLLNGYPITISRAYSFICQR